MFILSQKPLVILTQHVILFCLILLKHIDHFDQGGQVFIQFN